MVRSKTGNALISAGATGGDGDGQLLVMSKNGDIRTQIGSDEDGFMISGYNKTGDNVVHLYADEYGNGVVGVRDRKGKGRTLQPGP